MGQWTECEEYLAGLEWERQDSLPFCNAEGKCYRGIEEEESRQKVQEASKEEVLQSACKFCCEVDTLNPLYSFFSIFNPLLGHNDVENYRKEFAEIDRASLCFRRTEASIQHMEEGEKREQ